MKQAIGYIRVSTDRQAKEGVSLEAQRGKIAAWCAVNDYELVDVFVDSGISGKRSGRRQSLENTLKKRPGLKNALDATKRGMALVVYSLSRMARSTRDTLDVSERLENIGADLVSVSEKIDTTGAAGKMVFRMMAVFAEFESDVISERTKSSLLLKKSKGEVYTAVTPFGYQAIEGRLVAVESEALVVADILKKRQAGETLQAIADELNGKGISGKTGGRWYPSTVRNIIQRKAA